MIWYCRDFLKTKILRTSKICTKMPSPTYSKIIVPQNQKVWNLSFHWKKINVVTILDQNLVRFEICNETSIFQIFTWYSWKSRFSTIYKLKILKTAKRLSRTAMTLIFCSSESWDSILFKTLQGVPKGGPGKDLFCFEIRLLN